ncbi:50S ribosomal protein L32 [Streptosporangium longisporum]|uniref:Large ribosomal subunit protein bL32 n=1 Tax=Streptosporangium longisporum TaxID=46187 RepID=A0ABP6KLP8_9ACTN
MAVPKRKMSRSNTRHRRSQWKATAPDLVPITVEGRELLVPRPLVRAYRRGLLTPR